MLSIYREVAELVARRHLLSQQRLHQNLPPTQQFIYNRPEARRRAAQGYTTKCGLMYKKEQASQLRQAFWTTLGQYIAPHPAADGVKVNWLNYRTGLKHVYFRMQADTRKATIAIELTHPDAELQELYYDQFRELKGVLHDYLGEEWEWQLHTTDENGKTVSRIYKELAPANVFNQDDWPQLISFFKPRIIALDEFWSNARYSFDKLW